jgi:hypothetical protein
MRFKNRFIQSLLMPATNARLTASRTGAPQSEPAGEAPETRLADRTRHRHQRPLGNLVLERRDAEHRSWPPAFGIYCRHDGFAR